MNREWHANKFSSPYAVHAIIPCASCFDYFCRFHGNHTIFRPYFQGMHHNLISTANYDTISFFPHVSLLTSACSIEEKMKLDSGDWWYHTPLTSSAEWIILVQRLTSRPTEIPKLDVHPDVDLTFHSDRSPVRLIVRERFCTRSLLYGLVW